ncbi:MAG TPA: site-specific integrase, partial [Methanomassiliicoccales archaeon]
IALRNCAVGLERILVHFELDCMMRRCEVLRLTVEDVKDGRIDIWGKGRSGGKPRSVPWHPRTGQEWMYYLKLREGLIAKARETNPTLVIPDEVMIYERRGELHPYRKTAIDRMVKNVGERAMIPKEEISNHVLRRSGARIHKRAGTPTATIMKILGHKTEEQTQRYLGLNLDDMSEGMVKAEEFMMGLEGTVPGHAPSGFKP